MRLTRVLLVGSAVTSMVAAGALTGAVQASAADTGSQSVIVLLKDQLSGSPADAAHLGSRRTGAHREQAAVLGRLSGAKAAHVVNYTVGNAFSATVTATQAAALASDPAVASVVPNRQVQLQPTAAPPTVTPKAKAAATGDAVDPAACSSDPKKPILEPEALQTINARSSDPHAKTAAALGIDGAGVKVAYIADGINPANAGFKRANGKSSIVDYKDFYGDGPNAPTGGAEAFGDASAISAQGNVVFDVADFSNPAVVSYPGGHCYIKIVGVAPGADVVALKAGSELLPNSAILQAIDYAVSVDHVNVLNESFGANLLPDSGARNTIELFNDQAVKAGTTVTVSTGDAGVTSTIGNPSTDPLVISAGASTDSRLYEQTGYALATKFGNGKWLDNNISSLSSAGITQSGRTIDLSAPGEADWALCDDSGNFGNCVSFGNPDHPLSKIQSFGGTSQSAPVTAGVAALVIQAYRTKHGGTTPTPAVVKQIITSTTRDLGLPGPEQGSGRIDARAAVEAALTWPGAKSPSNVASNIALSRNQLTLAGKPGSTKSGSVTVTNVGSKPVTIAASTRRFLTLSSATQQTALSTSSSQTTPYPTTGAPWVYKKLTFSVPTGADELNSTVRWQSGAAFGGSGPVVRLSLFAPDGTYAANTRPQGGAAPANYGLASVRHPAAGTWTAVLYTPATNGFTGTVSLDNQTYRAVPVGSVSAPGKALAPGGHATVRVRLPIPATGGDDTAAITIGSSAGHQTAVPVILRAIVPAPGVFKGTITGGNARAYSPAQTFSYNFDVPAGKKDVAVATTLADDPGDLLQGALIDPHGEVVSINSNATLNSAGDEVSGLSLRNVAAKPAPGRWSYVITVENPVSGKELTEDFTGTVKFNQVKTSGFPVPASLAKGSSTPVRVSVTNTGPAPMLVQTDARTGAARATQLAPQFAGSTLTLPQSVEDLSQLPAYLVPPDTTKLSVTASSTVPAQVELNNPGGGIDVFGDLRSAQKGSTISTASVSDSPVGLGFWGVYVQEIGPFGDGGAPAATSVLSATAQTKAFDSQVTTSTGDPFIPTVDLTADPGAPVIIPPGQTKTITVTFTAAGAKGSTHSGVLNLVTTPIGVAGLFNTTGEVLKTLPYSYKIS